MVFHHFSRWCPFPRNEERNEVMSAMVGTLPDAFTNEFLSLTDHLPVSRIEEVYRIIQRTFRQPPKVGGDRTTPDLRALCEAIYG